MKNKISLFILLLLVTGLLGVQSTQLISAATDTRTGSFTTPRGTAVSVSTTLEHDGSGSTPVLKTFTEYSLTVNVTLDQLSNDSVRDIHDLEFIIDIKTDSLIPGLGEKRVYSSYYFDSKTSMTADGSSKIYDFTILISGGLFDSETTQRNANLNFLFKVTEDIENYPDKTTDFDGISYALSLEAGDSSAKSSLTYSGNSTESRHISEYSDKGTHIKIDIAFDHEGNTNGKPTMKSYNKYPLTVNITLVELGTDPRDIHDLELEVAMIDESIINYVPGSDPARYFDGYASSNEELVDGNKKQFEFVIIPNTNINGSELSLDFVVKFKEDINNRPDPGSEFDTKFEINLNPGQSNADLSSDDSSMPFNLTYFVLFSLVAIPVLRKIFENKS